MGKELSNGRLTARGSSGQYYYPKCAEECDKDPETGVCANCDYDEMYCDRLGYYEDLEEQGLLLETPVAIGGQVYEVIEEDVPTKHWYIQTYEVQDVSMLGIKYGDDWMPREKMEQHNAFLTREAAEEKKRKLEGSMSWIPCNKRLPKEGEEVLISTRGKNVAVGIYVKEFGYARMEGFNYCGGFTMLENVLAWMPLPEIYMPFE